MAKMRREQKGIEELSPIAQGDDLDPEIFPELYNLSAAFIFNLLPYPEKREEPEYVYLDLPIWRKRSGESDAELLVKIHSWNYAWESGQLRYDIFGSKLPEGLKWLKHYRDRNVYLLPKTSFHHYESYAPLYHLLPRTTLDRFALPLLKKGLWPPSIPMGDFDKIVPRDFDSRLSVAFAYHVWPMLVSQSGMSSFSMTDPIRILAHNLDFWLPYIQSVAEDRLGRFDRLKPDGKDVIKRLNTIKKDLPIGVKAGTPRMGGWIWAGEEDAREATREMVEKADAKGRLRAIIDAVKSHRIEDDFSSRWSYAKEDFERKVYRKRSKIKVTFVELNETVPVHGTDSEVHENLLWEDFMGFLGNKEKRIVILLRNGVTKMSDIGERLGYANHSPISKALDRIRKKALKFLYE
jgi:hypothetical protein